MPDPLTIFLLNIIPPVLLKLRLSVVVIPTLLTVPTVKPEFSKKVIVPVFAAKVVMALPVFVNVYTPPVPSSSRPDAETFSVCVTVAVLLSVVLPEVVKPIVLTVAITNPEFSTKETVPVLPASVVIAVLALVNVCVPPAPNSSRPAATIAPVV